MASVTRAMIKRLFIVENIRCHNTIAKLANVKPETARKHLIAISDEIEEKCVIMQPSSEFALNVANVANEVRFQRETNELELKKVTKSLSKKGVDDADYEKLIRLKIAIESQLNKINGVDLALKLREKRSLQELDNKGNGEEEEQGIKNKGKAVEVQGF